MSLTSFNIPSCLMSKSELISNKRDPSTRVKRERPLLTPISVVL